MYKRVLAPLKNLDSRYCPRKAGGVILQPKNSIKKMSEYRLFFLTLCVLSSRPGIPACQSAAADAGGAGNFLHTAGCNRSTGLSADINKLIN